MDADALYRLTPEEFTRTRDAAARQRRADGDRDGAVALAALRRPSVAAWLVNRLAQDSPELLASLLDLGPDLARAQSGGDGPALRALGAQRRELVDAVTRTASAAAGRPVSAAVREEVAATLDAALSDPASAQAVRSGRLVRALSYAGWGEVDLSGAVAPSSVGNAGEQPGAEQPGGEQERVDQARVEQRRAEQQRAERLAAAQTAAQAAAGALDDAVRACEAAERGRVASAAEADLRAAEVAELADRLAQARRDQQEAVERAEAAQEAGTAALADVERAQAAATRARQELDRLRRQAEDEGSDRPRRLSGR